MVKFIIQNLASVFEMFFPDSPEGNWTKNQKALGTLFIIAFDILIFFLSHP